MEKRIIIRKYTEKDRNAVEQIQLETFFLGKPLDVKHKRLIHKDIQYYLEEEPESCFVAVQDEKVVGYILGCLDDNNHTENIFSYVLRIYSKAPVIPFMHKSDRKFWSGQISGITRALFGKSGEKKFFHPPNAGHIHINLLPEARGRGVGSELLKTFFSYAKSKNIKIIHADSFQTKINPNKNFWIKNGFLEYSNVSTSFWKKYYPNENIRLVCYYREI